jgi:hypothetical protein
MAAPGPVAASPRRIEASPVPAARRAHPWRWMAAAVILVLIVALLVPLINISRYHRNISESLSRSLGRPVHLGPVTLELLPRPGLSISGLVVEESPGFGAEPLLRAPSVNVFLRLSSLWRGRLEVSRIDLDDASLNLVRDPQGRWNFSTLLLEAAHQPTAPTAQRHPGDEPRFPYIEFSSARINFKNGVEKQAFSFLNADVSIWLDQPDQWRLRFEAQPARTDLDLDLADTGTMRAEGSLHRASELARMPVKLHAEWSGAALGQVSRMLLGRDSGWRGDLRADADIAGDLRDLRLQARVRIEDAHRQEFTPLTPLNVDAKCQADYIHGARSLENLTCLWPVGDGHLLLTGDLQNFAAPQPHLALEINQTPASFALSVLGLARKGLPPALAQSGVINGSFRYDPSATPRLDGHAQIDRLQLAVPGFDQPISVPALTFTTAAVPPAAPLGKPARRGRKSPSALASISAPALEGITLEPFAIPMGAPQPLTIAAHFTRPGFELSVDGDASLQRLTELSRTFGILSPLLKPTSAAAERAPAQPTPATPAAATTSAPTADSAKVSLHITGPWMAPLNPQEPRVLVQGTILPLSHP